MSKAKDQGYLDALRGHTTCPYGMPASIKDWHKGYDKADKEETSTFTRFRDLKRKS